MSWIELSAKPCVRSAANASSRFGPTVPCAFASASVWKPAQVEENSFLPLCTSRACALPPVPQPAAESATARGRRRRAAARRTLGRGGPARRHGRDRLAACRVDREDAVESGDLEDLGDVAVAADERELAVVRAQSLDAADEHAERRRVDEGRVREVDYDVLPALADHLEELLLELRRRVEVHLACERDHERVVSELLGPDVEVHRCTPGLVDARPLPVGESIHSSESTSLRAASGAA